MNENDKVIGFPNMEEEIKMEKEKIEVSSMEQIQELAEDERTKEFFPPDIKEVIREKFREQFSRGLKLGLNLGLIGIYEKMGNGIANYTKMKKNELVMLLQAIELYCETLMDETTLKKMQTEAIEKAKNREQNQKSEQDIKE